MTVVHHIPLWGKHITLKYGQNRRGLVIRASDCKAVAAPPEVNRLHANLQRVVDRRKIPDDEQVGWIEHDENGEVTDWHLEERLLE